MVEGFKRFPHPKLEVHRRERGTPLLARDDPTVVAVASDEPLHDLPMPQFGPRRRGGDRRASSSSGSSCARERASPRTASRMAASHGSPSAPRSALLEARTAPCRGRRRPCRWPGAGRFLAERRRSPRDVPAFDNAAVDGYAFAFAGPMREAGRGSPWRRAGPPPATLPRPPLPAGAALRVLTGARCRRRRHGGAPGGGRGRRRGGRPAGRPEARRQPAAAGEDVRAGQVVLQPGARLQPQEIGLAAELGRAA